MKKIMFVCHGNICRSPMAEMIFNHLAESFGLQNELKAFSSATSYEETGNPVYPPAKKVLAKNNIPFKEHHAAKLYPQDYEKYDMFIVMDQNNLRNIGRIFTSDPEGKIHKLLSFSGSDADVSDPYHSGDFNRAFSDIYKGVNALISYLEQKPRTKQG